MINLRNKREESIPYTVPPATAVLAPTTTATLAPRWICKKAGKIKAAVFMVTTVGTAGNSTDLKETVKVQKRGVTGAVTAVVVTEAPAVLDLNLTPDYLPAVGTRIIAAGLAGNSVVQGEILEAVWTETGTIGTATRAQISIIDVILESASHMDASI